MSGSWHAKSPSGFRPASLSCSAPASPPVVWPNRDSWSRNTVNKEKREVGRQVRKARTKEKGVEITGSTHLCPDKSRHPRVALRGRVRAKDPHSGLGLNSSRYRGPAGKEGLRLEVLVPEGKAKPCRGLLVAEHGTHVQVLVGNETLLRGAALRVPVIIEATRLEHKVPLLPRLDTDTLLVKPPGELREAIRLA